MTQDEVTVTQANLSQQYAQKCAAADLEAIPGVFAEACMEFGAFTWENRSAIGESLAETATLRTEVEALKAKLEAAEKDSERLNWLQSEMHDVRWVSGHGSEMCSPSDEVAVRIVSHHQAEPCERTEAENWHEDLRAVIDEARTGENL